MNLSAVLVAISATVIGLLGSVHLFYTFFSAKFNPRDDAVRLSMQTAYPVLTRQTTLWRAWLGFNASHSLGALLFGAVYGYLALWQADFLFRQTRFLLLVGLLVLLAYVWLAHRYWFRIPQRGIALATLLYLLAVALNAA
mgnify:CR=1 FL=1